MTVNQEMFAVIDGYITELPHLHRQYSWEVKPEDNGTCGTTRCIAGWATWEAARMYGLLSRKREQTDDSVRERLADLLGLPSTEAFEDEHYYHRYHRTDFAVIGGRVLGLTGEQAESLFHDMNNERVAARVHAFATTGQDLPAEEWDRFDEDDD